MWQAEADIELTLSAPPTTAVGQKALALAKRRYSTVKHEHYFLERITVRIYFKMILAVQLISLVLGRKKFSFILQQAIISIGLQHLTMMQINHTGVCK